MRSWVPRFLTAVVIATGLVGAAPYAADEAGGDADAMRELLQGASGHREAWTTVPELVIVSAVLDFTGDDMSRGYAATDEVMSDADIAHLERDLTSSLRDLTGAVVTAFADVHIESAKPGQQIRMFRRGQIVVGRSRGVQARAGTLGYGGRTARSGDITAGALILDADFDARSDRRQLLRTHELGHALGFNHVESRRSVMNPRVATDITDFDRQAIHYAFARVPPAASSFVIGTPLSRQN